MDELESMFTIDRCGDDTKLKEVLKNKNDTNNDAKTAAILYRCHSKLLEVQPSRNTGSVTGSSTGATSRPSQHQHLPKQLNKRMHEASMDEQRVNPGKLSENLRRALGLTKYGLPLHIYRMRYLGYPPGWLRKIETRPSELKFIGDESKRSGKSSIEYRTEDLIEYPGFNTLINYDPEEDRWRDLGMVAMRQEHSLEAFARSLKGRQQQQLSPPPPHPPLSSSISSSFVEPIDGINDTNRCGGHGRRQGV